MSEGAMQMRLADNHRTGSVSWSHYTPLSAHALTPSIAEEKP